VKQRTGKTSEIDLCDMHLGGIAIEVLGTLMAFPIIDDVAGLQGLSNRVVVVRGPTLPTKAGVGRIIEKRWGDTDEPGQTSWLLGIGDRHER